MSNAPKPEEKVDSSAALESTRAAPASRWSSRYQREREYAERQARLSMAAVCEQLEKQGVEFVRVEYNGFGDSGAIENASASAGGKELKLNTSQETALMDAAYEILPSGWEINEGSFGELVLDVKKRSILREHSWRTETTEYEEEELEL